MKIWKKITAALLALTLVLCLCACGASEESKLVGTWRYDYDLAAYLDQQYSEMLGEELAVDAELKIPLILTLKADKTSTMAVDTEALGAALDNYMDALGNALIEYMYKMGEDSGMDRETFDSFFTEVYGMSLADYCKEATSDLNTEDLLEEFQEESGVFQAKDGKLYLENTEADFSEDSYVEYTLDGKTLTFNAAYGDAMDLEDLDLEYPVVFTKQ